MTRAHTSSFRPAVFMAYFMIYVVWGSTFFFINRAVIELPPYLLGALRFSIAGLIMLSVAAYTGERVMKRQLICHSAVCGMLLLFADMVAIMLALRYISSSLVAVLAASSLIWITLLDVPMWKTNFRSVRVLTGVAGGMGGVLLLYWGHLVEYGVHASTGVLIFLCGTLSWSLGTLYSKYRASRCEAVNALSGTAWQMLAASAAFWCYSLYLNEPASVAWESITPGAWGALAYLIVFGSLLAYTSYVWLLKIRPATEVGTHAYANPFIAILLGSCLGNEHISLSQWLGLAVILISLFLVEHHRTPNRA